MTVSRRIESGRDKKACQMLAWPIASPFYSHEGTRMDSEGEQRLTSLSPVPDLQAPIC